MSSIEQCIRNIHRYYNLEEKVEAIIKKLDSAADDTSSLEFHIKNNYKVDGDGATVAIRTNDLKNELIETRNYLKNTILPSISSSIREEKREKARLEEEEDD